MLASHQRARMSTTEIEGFLRHLQKVQRCSPETVKAYRADLARLGTFLAEQGLPDIYAMTRKKVGTYIEWLDGRVNARTGLRGMSDATIFRSLASASSFMEYLRYRSDEDLKNPFHRYPLRRKRHDNPNPVEEYTLDLLLSSMTPRDQLLYRLMAASGLRVSEAASLNRDTITLKDVIDEDGVKYTIGEGVVTGKGGKTRSFRIDEETADLCAEYIESRKDSRPELFTTMRGKRMSVRAMQQRLQKWCRDLKFSHVNVHRLRHTFATQMVNNGMRSNELKALLGHESLNTVAKYFKLHEETLSRSYHAAIARSRTRL
jgi:integrase/recombinase XerC